MWEFGRPSIFCAQRIPPPPPRIEPPYVEPWRRIFEVFRKTLSGRFRWIVWSGFEKEYDVWCALSWGVSLSLDSDGWASQISASKLIAKFLECEGRDISCRRIFFSVCSEIRKEQLKAAFISFSSKKMEAFRGFGQNQKAKKCRFSDATEWSGSLAFPRDSRVGHDTIRTNVRSSRGGGT